MNEVSSMVVEIEGKRFELLREAWENLDCISVGQQTYHLIENGKSHTVSVIDFDLATRTCTLKVDGEIKQVRFIRDLDLLIEKMGLNVSANKKISALHAPMPGMVTGIRVTAGQEVEKGSPILILEAMKMENVITSPDQAVVKEVRVAIGQAVEKGSVLIEFE